MTDDWRDVVLKATDKLDKSISVLDAGGIRIAIVLSESGELLGTMTDGDVRRALLQHLSMDVSVIEVMNKNPITAKISDNRKEILTLMKAKDLLHVPVVDADKKMVRLETIGNLIQPFKIDNPVFIMAGGFGKRLRPLTDNTPKPLLKIGSKPILEIIISQFISEGFHDFYISTHYKSKMIEDYFGDGSLFGISIVYVHEETPLGTAGALGLLSKYLSKKNNLPIIMMNGDLLTKVNFNYLLDYHSKKNGIATICSREYKIQVPYGVIISKAGKVVEIEEKPEHKFLVNAGIYIVSRELMELVDSDHYIDMPHLLEREIEKGNDVSIFPLHEYWLDIGNMSELESANNEYYNEFVSLEVNPKV
jgi:dTDP-glucose pyrophosphorylase